MPPETLGRRWRRGLACGLALLALAAPAPARAERWDQLTQIGFRTLTRAQGLPNAIATAVAQDGDGFLWVGTLGGLARWDGYHFRVFRADPGRPGALPDNVIQTLHTDPAGRLWVGTSAAGLVRWDSSAERFARIPAGPGGLSHVSVRAIADDGAGGLWVGTEGGLDHLDPATGAVRSARAGDAATEGLPAAPVFALLRDRRGALWVGSADGLYAGRGGRFEPVPGPASVQSLAEDADGRIWVGTERQGAFVIGPDGGPPQPVHAPARDGDLANQPVVAMLEVRPGETWLGTLGWGIVAVDAGSGRTRNIRNLPALPASLADNAVRALFRDRSGLVWVATNRGLSRYDPGQSAVLTMFGTPVDARARAAVAGLGTDVASMGNTQISWILPTGDGRIWLGTHKGGVDIIDPDGARVGRLAPDPAHPLTALPADMVLALAPAGDGSIFIGTKRGLYRASADGRQVRRVSIAGRDPTASTWALLVDGSRLWIGGQFDGLWQLDLHSGSSRPMLRGPGQALTDLRTTVLLRGPDGWLWIGTRNGLNRYDPATGVLQRIRREASRPDGLDAGFVATLYLDHRQRLWVGTYGGGIAILEGGIDAGRPRFVHLRTPQGLPDENVNSLLEDAAGQVWACTDGGLASIDPQTLAVRTLRRADGLLFPTYWTGSAARTAQGELLFGGDGGMTIVRPSLRQPWTWRPPLVVTQLHIGGRPLPVGPYAAAAASAPAPAHGPAPPPLQVPAAANSLAVEFAALDYSAPARNRYAYRLQGYDPDWIDTDAAHRVASYTNLPPGDYTLQLRGSNRDGLWSQAELALPLRVLPAWYQQLWARAAAVLALLGLGAAAVRWRTRYLRAQQIALERKVGERTAMLEQVSRALAEKTRILEQTSVSDPLTGLRNRRFLAEHIEASIGASLRRGQEARLAGQARPPDADTLFLLIDIDHFKSVNDRYGHAAGDAVLVQVGQRLQALMRETDFVVRWGGEEFLAVARDTDRSRAEELAERVRDVVAGRPFRLDDGAPLALSASVGFACLPFVEPEPRALGWEEVVKLADLALFAAKRLGRNAWVGLHATAAAHAEGLPARVQADPQRALDQGEVRLSSSHPAPAAQAALLALGPAGPAAPAASATSATSARPSNRRANT